MRIGYDAKRMFYNRTGLGNYSRSLFRHYADLRGDAEFTLYPFRDEAPRVPFRTDDRTTITRRPITGAVQRQWRVTGELRRAGIDLYHGLSNELPLNIGRADVKSVVTIHDLIFRRFPRTYPLVDRLIYDFKSATACRNADRIITVSESTKADISRYYGTDPLKVSVVPPIIDQRYFSPPDVRHDVTTLRQLAVPDEYMLIVGTVERRKNLERVLLALADIEREHRPALVVVGGGSDYKLHCRQLARDRGLDGVIWLDYLEREEELRVLYRRAMFLIYPSLYEGFGMPVAEALLSGTPVITSNVSSLPEALGPGGILVDPGNTAEVSKAILALTLDAELRGKLAELGRRYAREQFNPLRLSQRLDTVYRSVLKS